jgi:hypothetical protein
MAAPGRAVGPGQRGRVLPSWVADAGEGRPFRGELLLSDAANSDQLHRVLQCWLVGHGPEQRHGCAKATGPWPARIPAGLFAALLFVGTASRSGRPGRVAVRGWIPRLSRGTDRERVFRGSHKLGLAGIAVGVSAVLGRGPARPPGDRPRGHAGLPLASVGTPVMLASFGCAPPGDVRVRGGGRPEPAQRTPFGVACSQRTTEPAVSWAGPRPCGRFAGWEPARWCAVCWLCHRSRKLTEPSGHHFFHITCQQMRTRARCERRCAPSCRWGSPS